MGGLLEVHMGNAIHADIVVVDKTELSARGNVLDQLGGSVDVGVTASNFDSIFSGLGADVLSGGLQAEGIEVHGSAAEVGLVAVVPSNGVSVDVQSGAKEAEKDRGAHLDRAGTRVEDESWMLGGRAA